jgi:hypothetical protein
MRSNQSGKKSVLKQVFDRYVEDTISDEQMNRVLEPVLRLIREGAFDRPRGFFYGGRRRKPRPVEYI